MRKAINEVELPEMGSMSKDLINLGNWSLFYDSGLNEYFVQTKDTTYVLNKTGYAIDHYPRVRLSPEVVPVMRVI